MKKLKCIFSRLFNTEQKKIHQLLYFTEMVTISEPP